MQISSLNGFGLMFSVLPILFFVVFIFVFVVIIIQTVRGAQRWNKNSKAPVLTVAAKVVAKRSDVNTHRRMRTTVNDMNMGYATTDYYVTFEVQSGDRMELNLPDTEYGMLTEGDKGELTFQGTKYISYARDTRI